nr:phosphoenolpyruvate carboxylase [Betaproteobacteria bacterium]
MEAFAEFTQEAKEHLLREDRRLLGRLLGEAIREQAGEAMLERVERIRQTAVAFRRAESGAGPEAGAHEVKAELESLLNALDIEQTLHVVRAFSYFSHLLNIAEDVQQNRRRRAHAEAGSPPRPGSLAHALDRLQDEGRGGEELLAWLSRARVSPVLTAHPTEVQRQSILDCEREIARLLAAPQNAARDEALQREVLRLWLTSMLRLTRLEVADEINNALAYFRMTFLAELPRLYADLEAALQARFGLARTPRLASFLTVGTWIGGDRDGNPHVTAAVLKHALAQQAQLALGHYLGEVNQLGRELSVSTRVRAIPQALRLLAEGSGDDSPYRRDEPYRRALSGIYARLAASAAALAGLRAVPAPGAALAPTASAEELAA